MKEGGVTFVSPQHGVCYMFNFGPLYANQDPGVNMIAANVYYGLALEIDLESKFVYQIHRFFICEFEYLQLKIDHFSGMYPLD